MMRRKNFQHVLSSLFYWSGVILIGVVFGLLLKTSSAWVEPSGSDNIFSPLNSGSIGQSKLGSLVLNVGGAAYGLIVEKGKVGIGTTFPKNKLHVEGENGNIAGIYINDAVPSSPSNTLYNNGGNLFWNGSNIKENIIVNGSTNYIAKFTGTSAVGNSVLFDNGTNIGVGTTSPNSKLEVIGDVRVSGDILGADLDCYTTDWGPSTICATEPEAVHPECNGGYTDVGIASETHSDIGCGHSSLNRQKVKTRCCRVK